MKKIISVLLALALVAGMVKAQDKQEKKNGHDWRERVRAEQVAFITNELDLSESEAQAFWPVYNEIQKQRREAFKAVGQAFAALQEGAEEKDAAKLLDQYLAAKKAGEKIEADAVARYKKVLPVSKVAKLILAEEKFRQNQIHRLGQGKGPGQGGRPGPGMPPPGARQPQTNEPSTK
jgi:hypothetical protein